MNEWTDEQLQQWLEGEALKPAPASITSNQTEDLKAYRFVFDQLNQEPTEGFSYGFSKKVMQRLRSGRLISRRLGWYTLVVVILILGFGLTYGMLGLLNPVAASRLFELVNASKGLIFLGLITFLTVQYLDERLIHRY
jgi:hypothetical protein